MTGLPEPAECAALADDLVDMMAADKLDHGILRRAANALRAVADRNHRFASNGSELAFAGLVEGDGGADPLGDGLLASFEGGEHGDASALANAQ